MPAKERTMANKIKYQGFVKHDPLAPRDYCFTITVGRRYIEQVGSWMDEGDAFTAMRVRLAELNGKGEDK